MGKTTEKENKENAEIIRELKEFVLQEHGCESERDREGGMEKERRGVER